MLAIECRKLTVCEEEISESLFNAEQKKWLSKFGSTDKAAADFIWSIFNRKIALIQQWNLNFPDRYELFSKAYSDMIRFLSSEVRNTMAIHSILNRTDLEIFELQDLGSNFESAV